MPGSVAGRVWQARFLETLGAQPAGVAQSACAAVGCRIIAAVAEPCVEPKPCRLARDVGLGHVLEGCMDGKTMALDAGPGRLVGQRLEGGDELRTAIGITGIIERI